MKDLPRHAEWRDSDDDEFYSWDLSYGDLINSMEVETLVEVSDDNYQGDTRSLLRGNRGYGLLTFGWGSCSGCDALQGAGSREEATKLRDELHRSIHWEPDAAAMAGFLREKDWSADYMRGPETTRFVREALALLDPDGPRYVPKDPDDEEEED